MKKKILVIGYSTVGAIMVGLVGIAIAFPPHREYVMYDRAKQCGDKELMAEAKDLYYELTDTEGVSQNLAVAHKNLAEMNLDMQLEKKGC